MVPKINPKEDGITHINVYSKGRTQLGRMLSNFSDIGFKLPNVGEFKSIEGFWYWLQTKDERLRDLSGYHAKKLGGSLEITGLSKDSDAFKGYISLAIDTKIISNEELYNLFKASTLPFEHYYVYGDKVVYAGYKWILEHLEQLRRELNDSTN